MHHCAGPDNRQLADYLERIAAGDRARFEMLYQLTASRLWAVVRRMVVQKQSAQDVLQEAYLTIWRKAHLFDQNSRRGSGVDDHDRATSCNCMVASARQCDARRSAS